MTTSTVPTPKLGKRKVETEKPSTSSKKRRQSKSIQQTDNGYLDSYADVDEELRINRSIGRMSPHEVTEYVESIYNHPKFRGNLTEVEMQDLRLPTRAIKDTTSWTEPRTLNGMSGFVKEMIASGNETKKSEEERFGCPHTLVVTASAIRAADVVRQLRGLQQKGCGIVAKLFAKHVKLEESVTLCKKTDMIMGVGTPKRLMDLLLDGALSTTRLRRIVLDASFVDEKKRGIFQIKEVGLETLKLLSLPNLQEKYDVEENALELILY